MQSELKPCPFCGWATGLSVFDGGDQPYWVECPDCCAQGSPEETKAEAITAWNTRASDAEITRLTEALRAADEREKALRGIVNGFIGLVISSGLTEDLVAQVFPDMKRKNGQPASTFAKNARRMVNEARQALAGAKP